MNKVVPEAKERDDSGKLSRRQFLTLSAAGSAATLLPTVTSRALAADSPSQQNDIHLSLGGPVANFGFADPNKLDATYANATGRNFGLSSEGGAYASYQFANNEPSEYCGCRLHNRTGGWDFSQGDNIAVELGFDTQANGDDYHSHTYIVVFLVMELHGFVNYFRSPVINNSTIKLSRDTIVIRKSEFETQGTPSWDKISRIEVRLNRSVSFPGGPNAFRVFKVWSFSGRTTLVFCFDDGRNSVLDNAINPWFIPNGWRCTIGVNSSNVGRSGNLALDSLLYLHSLGMDMSNHTAHHEPLCYKLTCNIIGNTATYSSGTLPHRLRAGTRVAIRGFGDRVLNGVKTVLAVPSPTTFRVNLTDTPSLNTGTGFGSMSIAGLSESQIDDRVLECQAWLENNNLRTGNDLFLFPYGYFDYASIARIKRLGFKSARTVRPGVSLGTTISSGIAAFNPKYVDLYALPAISLSSTSTRSNTAEKVLAIIDDAIARGTSAFLTAHDIVAAPTTNTEFDVAEFNLLIDGIKQRTEQGLCTIQSYSDWYTSLNL